VTLLQRLNPESAPAPVGAYSQLSITSENARIATFAGQIGVTATSSDLPTGIGDQARLAFAAIEALLDSQGATPADLVRLLTFVVGRENLAQFQAARGEVYAAWFPDGDFPTNTLVIVAGLAQEGILVEIEGSFACPPAEQ
jgi:enamine deaminase RidA (YjgF/YER057c/UK114 family)